MQVFAGHQPWRALEPGLAGGTHGRRVEPSAKRAENARTSKSRADELDLYVTLGHPAVIVDHADEMRTFSCGPPRHSALRDGALAEEFTSIEPEDVGYVARNCGLERNGFRAR